MIFVWAYINMFTFSKLQNTFQMRLKNCGSDLNNSKFYYQNGHLDNVQFNITISISVKGSQAINK